MNRKRTLQQYHFILQTYKHSDRTYTHTYHNPDDLYVFLHEFENMNVYSTVNW